ncbi:MAG: NADH-quinone oxidoreductase subunit G [Alphaproteobacteria bacterium]|jgi:NADH-quinone oxidoreductase subunit G|nr:NADH-quinone oxidoreductase subunit G [Alphaproteobacteria bacterium]MBT5390515.1 NADH-quinone oxidoreductase subunit G [Alphaproteobacteria bacterium]
MSEAEVKTIKLTVNDQEVEIEKGSTVLQACEKAAVEVPVFCYHPRLPIAGNCRMCLVELENCPKPVASCAHPAGDGMVIRTDSPMVTKARKGVLEFLLINHPLDCPICDQGGECDLQDITMAYGPDRGRFCKNKRAVEEEELGPLINTFMTRCIHCTRCVRFGDEIAGVPEMGATFRGEDMKIGTYIQQAITNELSGNMIDICPVGALTSKPYTYTGRSWELKKTDSIDVHDAVGSNIRVDTRGREVMRILPRLNEGINEEWISDKTRFSYDGLKSQRLDRPYVRVNGKLTETSWEEAFLAIRQRIRKSAPEEMAAIVGDQADCESIMALKDMMSALGTPHIDCRQDGSKIKSSERSHYLFNTSIEGIEKADLCLLIGTNPKWEGTMINARLRKRSLAGNFPIALVGDPVSLTYEYQHLGDTPEILEEILSGKHPFSKKLSKAKRPMLILGQGALCRSDGDAVFSAAVKIAEDYGFIQENWNGFNVLHTAASRVGALDLGFVPSRGGLDAKGILSGIEKGDIKFLYLLGADEMPLESLPKKRRFIVYQGHHGDKGAMVADVILPGSAYTEKDATFVNTEGRVQRTYRAIFPPGEAKEDWRILRALAEVLEHKPSYNSLEQLRQRMIEENPVFDRNAEFQSEEWKSIASKVGKLIKSPFDPYIKNYYMTDPITRSSQTMAKCTESFILKKQEAA